MRISLETINNIPILSQPSTIMVSIFAFLPYAHYKSFKGTWVWLTQIWHLNNILIFLPGYTQKKPRTSFHKKTSIFIYSINFFFFSLANSRDTHRSRRRSIMYTNAKNCKSNFMVDWNIKKCYNCNIMWYYGILSEYPPWKVTFCCHR